MHFSCIGYVAYLMYVFPILTYDINAKNLSQKQIHELSVCYNNMFIRIFGLYKWDSVKFIQFFCGKLDFLNLYNSRRISFLSRLWKTNNVINECLFRVYHSKQVNDCCVPITCCRVVVCLRVTLLVLFRTLLLICVCVKIVVISVAYLSFLSIMFLCFMSTVSNFLRI